MNKQSRRRTDRLTVLLAAISIVAAACGSDTKTSTATTPSAPAVSQPAATQPKTTQPTETNAPGTTAPAKASALDTNKDGKVVFGIAAAGPADDGAYYQAVVDALTKVAKDNGYEAPIVVDNIGSADAETSIGNLAQQGVDVIIVGASEIAEPLPSLITKYPDVFWYCNCGAGYPANPGLAQATDDGGEIGYTAGYATGLKLKEKGGDSTVIIGCCDLGFEKQAYMSFELGLKAVDAKYTMTYVPSGSQPFDFDNTANATAALQTAIDNGTDAVYPYLGGALKPVVQAANAANIITMSAGSSKVCDDAAGLKYDIAVRFDAGDYITGLMKGIQDGTFKEGDTKQFKVGVDPEPGAKICNATAEQQTAMDDLYKKIASGALAADLGKIAGIAFAPS
jgi:basic membrane protein A and related proteins